MKNQIIKILKSELLTIAIFYILYFFVIYMSFSRISFFQDFEHFSKNEAIALMRLFVLILIVYWFFQKKYLLKEKIKLRIAIYLLLPIIIALIITPPFLSKDIFSYQIEAKNTYQYFLNPYSNIMCSADNTWCSQIGAIWWTKMGSFYGPLFHYLLFPIGIINIGNLITSTVIYKIFTAMIFLFSVYIFSKLVKILKLPDSITVIYAFNPAILIHGVLEGHNDIFIILFLLVAMLYLLKKELYKSNIFFAFSVAVKYYTLIIIPVFWFENKKLILRKAIYSLLTFSLIFLFFFLPFVSGAKDWLERIIFETKLPCFYNCSPFILLSSDIGKFASIFRMCIFVILYIYVGTKYLYFSDQKFKFVFWILFIFFFIQVSWLTPWVLISMIPIGLLLYKEEGYLALTYIITCYSLLHFIW